jgi:hypothetical protein
VELIYDSPPSEGPLRQAEIVRDLVEHRTVSAQGGEGGQVDYLVVHHALAVVMSQDCDLEQDFAVRFPEGADPPDVEDAERHPNALSHVLLCDAYGVEEIRALVPNFGSKDWRRVSKNQNERYHSLEAAPIGGPGGPELEAIVLDFRKHSTVPTSLLYEQLSPSATRAAVVPPYFLHDLVHRFYGYLSRVAIP